MIRWIRAYSSPILSVLAAVSLLGAGIIGQVSGSNGTQNDSFGGNEYYLIETFPTSDSFETIEINNDTKSYLYQALSNQGEVEGYITIGTVQGYFGPMKVVVAWSPEGTVLKVFVPDHTDVADYFLELYKQDYFEQYIGRSYGEPLIPGKDIDTISGATISSNHVLYGVRMGRVLLSKHLASIL